ncbi:MAG: hypothetical protein MK196_02705, partial [Acidimicrobiales bacterium]|nr:hypothetical protein [Acidimicrobiales bacterium]
GMIGTMAGDLTEFQRWATGNLVENRNRGIFGEWLVGQALEVIGGMVISMSSNGRASATRPTRQVQW